MKNAQVIDVENVTWKPAANLVLVRLTKEDEYTKSGLIIPDSARKYQQFGTIVEVADDFPEAPMHYTPGQIVLVPNNSSLTLHEENGEKYVILNQFDIKAYKKA